MKKRSLLAHEVSWLSFNARVLQEANDPSLPLKQRIRFLAIHASNSDEFYRVRVALLKKMIRLNTKKSRGYLGKNPQKILDQIHTIVLQQQDEFDRIWKNILKELKKEKVFLVDDKQLNAKQKVFVRNYFDEEVRSSLITLFIDSMPHLPSFGDKNIYLGIKMQKNNGDRTYAIIEIPTKNRSRFVSLPSAPGEQNIMLLEDLVRFNLSRIFSHLDYTHFEAHTFEVTKDQEIEIDHNISTSFIDKIQDVLKKRRKAKPIRFIYDKEMNARLLEILIRKLNLSHKDCIIPAGHISNFRDFMDFPALLSDSLPCPRPFKHPMLAKSSRVSDVIMQHDLLLHFPYHSFNTIIDLLREAAMDRDVKSIKITLYRLAPHSKICSALINAARNGKRVHVILELRASFDEAANLEWKTLLEEEGVKVFVGNPTMKVHAKICVIQKKVGHRFVNYGFIGTGNLNEKTALSYIDLFLLTSNPAIMADINRIIKVLENSKTNWRQLKLCKTLLVAPLNMRKALFSLINHEIKAARLGKHAEIIINQNSLSDDKLIKKLYKAKEEGVKIALIVRGIYCAGGMKAISIVDEFLEHSRIWLFHNSGDEKIYISSADWRVRNLDYRFEVAVPITDPHIKEELKQILKIKLSDNVKARWLNKDFSNEYVSEGKKKVRSQRAIYYYLKKRMKRK